MTGAELLAAIWNLEKFFANNQYLARFQSLVTIAKSMKNDLNGGQNVQLTNSIDALTVMCVQYENQTGFPFDNNPALNELKLHEVLGTQNLAVLEDYLLHNQLDAETKVLALSQMLQTKQNAIRQLANSFRQTQIDMRPGYFSRPDDLSIVRVEFPLETGYDADSISTAINNFDKNLRLVGRFSKKSRELKYEVKSINKASPVVVEFLVWSGLAYGVLKAINEALTSVEKIQKIRLAQEQLRELKLKNQDKIDSLLDAEKDEAGKMEMAAAQAVLDTAETSEMDGEVNEVEKAVKTGINGIQNLIVEGGHVSVYITPSALPESSDQPRDLIGLKRETAGAEKHLAELRMLESGN